MLYNQRVGIGSKAIADDDIVLCGGHGDSDQNPAEQRYGAEHLHGKLLSFDTAIRGQRALASAGLSPNFRRRARKSMTVPGIAPEPAD
jgi:hypothetical protein